MCKNNGKLKWERILRAWPEDTEDIENHKKPISVHEDSANNGDNQAHSILTQ